MGAILSLVSSVSVDSEALVVESAGSVSRMCS
jgi:hypothetical protein